MSPVNSKIWTETEIVELLNKSDKAVIRGVIDIYRNQTSDEQSHGETINRNGIGFNGVDSRYLSYIAKYAIQNGTLTGVHLDKTRQKLLKYRKQLLVIANSHSGEQHV